MSRIPPCDSALVWFRRDLRPDDHHALAQALQAACQVHCVFVFDRAILDALPRADRRVEFIRESLVELDEALRQRSGQAAGGLIVRHGWAAEDIPALARELGVQAVFANHDDEPQALARDAQVRTALAAQGIALHTFKDHSVFERAEVLSLGGTPYSVFTPYKNAWLKKVTPTDLAPHITDPATDASLHGRLAPRPAGLAKAVPTLADIGFEPTNLRAVGIVPGAQAAQALFDDFAQRILHRGRRRTHHACGITMQQGAQLGGGDLQGLQVGGMHRHGRGLQGLRTQHATLQRTGPLRQCLRPRLRAALGQRMRSLHSACSVRHRAGGRPPVDLAHQLQRAFIDLLQEVGLRSSLRSGLRGGRCCRGHG